eukprot:TRINITY_DN31203_c0_g1_i1.p1 TRINITY_DN31203_c0_g1~~TRINITY_DN31203_c0_g1_i1.p1  ORF type:complete len:470 (+),score=146.94 TRINITY_DN31203_c0_g1_i1:113-1522(+)
MSSPLPRNPSTLGKAAKNAVFSASISAGRYPRKDGLAQPAFHRRWQDAAVARYLKLRYRTKVPGGTGIHARTNWKRAHRLSDALTTELQQLRDEGSVVGTRSYNITLSLLSSWGMLSDVERVFRDMQERAIMPDHLTYPAVMSVYAQQGNVAAARRLLRAQEQSGLPSSAESFENLLGAIAKHSHLGDGEEAEQDALATLSEMREKNIAVGANALQRAIDACCNPATAERLLDRMPRPSRSALTALVGVAARGGDLERTQRYIELFDRHGYEPSLVAYNMLMDCYKRHGDWRRCMRVLDLITDQGLRPSCVSYGTALRACANAVDKGDAAATDAAKEIWDLAGAELATSSQRLHTVALSVCAAAGDADWADEIRAGLRRLRIRESAPLLRYYGEALRKAGREAEARRIELNNVTETLTFPRLEQDRQRKPERAAPRRSAQRPVQDGARRAALGKAKDSAAGSGWAAVDD